MWILPSLVLLAPLSPCRLPAPPQGAPAPTVVRGAPPEETPTAADEPEPPAPPAPAKRRLPQDVSAHVLAARAALAAGTPMDALDDYRCALAACTGDDGASLAGGVAQLLLRDVLGLDAATRLPFLDLAHEDVQRRGDPATRAEVALELANALSECMEFGAAADVLRGALARLEDDGEGLELRRVLFGELANQLLETGEYTRAQTAAEASLERAVVLEEGGDDAVANALLVVANVAAAMGEEEAALRYVAAGLASAAATGCEPARAELLLTRADLEKRAQRVEEARTTLGAAAKIAGELEDAGLLARILLAEIDTLDPVREREARHARLALARAVFERGEAGAAGDVTAAAEAWMLHREGDHARARALALAAARGFVARGELEQAFEAQDTAVRASLALHDLSAARAAVDESRRVVEEALKRVAPSDATKLRRRYLSCFELEQDLVALESSARPERAKAAALDGFRAAQRTKALSLLEQREREERGGPADASAREVLANGLGGAPDVDPERIRAALRDDRTALLEFVHGDERLYAYCVGPRGLARFELGPWNELETRARAFVEAVAARDDPSSALVVARLGHELYARLLEPVFRTCPDVTRWIVVPTPGLSILPFDALLSAPVAETDPLPPFERWPFLVRRFEIDYCPSSTWAALLAERPRRARPPRALVVAAPNYQREPGAGARSGAAEPDTAWGELPCALSEARSLVGQLVTDADLRRPAEFGNFLLRGVVPSRPLHGEAVDLYVGPNATRAALAAADARYSIVYCITHGRIDLLEPARTSLVLSWGRDGYEYFTLDDAARLSLDADLVVLSACQTAIGKPQRGEGLLSLAHAFLQARARGVIASLWPVNDLRTALLFEGTHAGPAGGETPRPTNFHQQVFLDGVAPARALCDAKRSATGSDRGAALAPSSPSRSRHSDDADPYFWAAFVYIGAVRPER